MKLELADPLLHINDIWKVWIQQVLIGAFQPPEPWRVDTVSKVKSNGADRRPIANTEPDRVNHVVEVLEISLFYPKRDVVEVRINVAGVVEEHTADVIADQRKAKLGVINQQRLAADRKSGQKITRTG